MCLFDQLTSIDHIVRNPKNIKIAIIFEFFLALRPQNCLEIIHFILCLFLFFHQLYIYIHITHTYIYIYANEKNKSDIYICVSIYFIDLKMRKLINLMHSFYFIDAQIYLVKTVFNKFISII